jgi:hypothetical protein
MANPLDSLRNLTPVQKGAVAVGSIGVVGLVVWQRVKAKKAGAAATSAPADMGGVAAPAGTAGEIQDPDTGTFYPDTAVDPDTGLSYQQEITEYGSVAAADSQYSGTNDQAALQGETPQEYIDQTGGAGGTTGGATVTTNAQWMAEVETGLSEQGYSASDIGQGLAAYFASKPLGVSSDGTNLFTMMNLAVSEYGPAPVGSYPLLIGSPSPPPGGGKTGAPEVSGGHVVSLSGNEAEIGWTGKNAAGYRLVIHGPGKINGRENTVSAPHASYSGLEAGHDYQVTVTPVGSQGTAGKPGTITFKTTGGTAPKAKTDGKPAVKQ